MTMNSSLVYRSKTRTKVINNDVKCIYIYYIYIFIHNYQYITLCIKNHVVCIPVWFSKTVCIVINNYREVACWDYPYTLFIIINTLLCVYSSTSI